LLVFFGALYAVRGVGVFWWWAADKGVALVALGSVLLLSVLGLPALAATLTGIALLVGLGGHLAGLATALPASDRVKGAAPRRTTPAPRQRARNRALVVPS
jgi:hypothetical protein